MKVDINSQHIIALLISLGQNISVQNVILSRVTLFFHDFVPTRLLKTDYIINMA